MLQSYIVYMGTLVLLWGIAILADRYNKKGIMWIIPVLLTFVAGFRHPSVGLDTQSYYANFYFISAKQFGSVFGMEESFKYITYFLMKLWNSPTFVVVVLAALTHVLIIRRLWDFRNVASFCTMVVCYYMGFFHMSLNVMRQFVSIAIVFYATRYLIKSRYLIYFVLVIIAAMFHQSATVGLVFLICELFKWRTFSPKRRAIFLTVTVCSPAIIYIVISNLLQYSRYLTGNTDVGIMVFIKTLFLIVTLVLMFAVKVDGDGLRCAMRKSSEIRYIAVFVPFAYAVGLVFLFSSYCYEILNRIGWYFTLFESVYMGILMKSKRDLKVIYLCYIISVIGWGFLVTMLENSQGSMPYLFMWQ